MAVNRTERITLPRIVGNTEKIYGQFLTNDKTAIDLTGRTITFRMVNLETGAAKVDDASATLETASSGIVSYTPSSGDVDTAGAYAAYFTDDTGRRVPFDGAAYIIKIMAETEETS